MGSKSNRDKKAYQEKSMSHLWVISHRLPCRKAMLIGGLQNGYSSFPPSIYTSLLCDLEDSPIKE